MAFRDSYGYDSNPGRWWTLPQRDAERNVPLRLRIKPMQPEKRREILEKYGERVQQADGSYEYELRGQSDAIGTRAMACDSLTDTENVWIRISSASALTLYKDELHLGDTVSVGDEVQLDGKLTARIKEDLFREDFPLAAWVIGKATEVYQEDQKTKKVLEKNSESTSASPLNGQFLRSNAEGAESTEDKESPASLPTS